MSGAGWTWKNDVRTPTESWELKTTTRMQFALKAAELAKAWAHAVIDCRRMVFGIEFGNGKRYVVLEHDDYTGLRDALDEQQHRADNLAKDYRALVAQMVAGLATVEHDMAMTAGIPICRCGKILGGGKASEAFITHALALRDGA
jgi:hypothetical protein